MKPCLRVGLDVTWRCNWRCAQCFYLRNPNLHKPIDVPMEELQAKVDQGRAGGLNHVVLVGYGEPMLGKNTPAILAYARDRGMATSMITNGTAPRQAFERLFDHGLDHLHISSHGLDGTLDDIVGAPGAFRQQAELKEWLAEEEYPFRTNVALQQANYTELPDLADYEAERKVFHFVFLGFLPHYEWRDHTVEVAVHPTVLRPYIQEAAERLLDAGVFFTIRYHPLCRLSSRYWRYVVNARYCQMDPWEWNYTLQAHDTEAVWRESVKLGEQVANKTPCNECLAYRHCGGWNATYAKAFGGADLQPIREVPDQYRDVWDQDGGLHDMNPINHLTGTIRYSLHPRFQGKETP